MKEDNKLTAVCSFACLFAKLHRQYQHSEMSFLFSWNQAATFKGTFFNVQASYPDSLLLYPFKAERQAEKL